MLALAVSLGIAEHLTAMGDVISSGTSSWQGSDYEIVYWSQFPTGSPFGSQYFTDLYPEFDAGVADDFEFAETTTITRIRWWGGYWNGSQPYPIDTSVLIYLYLDDGTGHAPTLPQHSTAIQTWIIPPGNYDEVLDGSYYRCEFDFPSGVVFDPGVKYWFEIRKSFAYTPYGLYGWVESAPGLLAPSVQGFDGLGIPWWRVRDAGSAFELTWVPPTTLDRSTWAEIKTIF